MATEMASILMARPTRAALDSAFREDVLAGLSGAHRAIPARWLYDLAGSQLFEDITRLPEYYLTRTERALLSRCAAEIALLTGPGRMVVEFGSGSSLKTPLVLKAVDPSVYVPIDISGEFLAEAVGGLSRLFPDLPIHPVVADFMKPLDLPDRGEVPCLGFFPGSTIGNLVAPTAVDLLRAMADGLGRGAQLLIGIDRIKGEDILLPAYDDAQGVTARFNLNLLHRINRELQGTVPVDAFRHVARWNDPEGRVEMHLEALRDVRFKVAGQDFRIRAGETIHTENSVKYGAREASLLLRSGGWTPIQQWTDEAGLFALVLAEVTPQRRAP